MSANVDVTIEAKSSIQPVEKAHEDSSLADQSSTDILEKMTRRLFECSYCKERFPNVEVLKKHTQMHLGEEDDPLSTMPSCQEDSSGYNHTEENIDLCKEHPGIFKKTARVCLERVDTMETPMEHVGEVKKKAPAKGNLLNGSQQPDSKKSKRGTH